MKKRILSLLLALVMIFGLIPVSALAADTSTNSGIDEMSLRDKITQMMMVDFRKWGEDSTTTKDFTVMNDEVRKIVEDYNFGAVIFFANNISETEQSFNLTQAFQEAATKDGGIPLLIAADQEGGSVYRLGSGTALPGNMALGATYAANGTKYAEETGKIIGSELSVLGINTNLAPVVDVNSNANNPVIGLRSYSDNAAMVGELAAAEIEGMAQYNVIGCAKHFPGHGDTAIDSHYGLPIVDKSLSVLLENELKPYEVAIAQGIEMVMTAHILYPQLEADKILSTKTGEEEFLPATMSDDILTGLLKEDMGFEGIIITDAMNMAGITNNWDPVQSCVIAIQAGVDMICMPTRLYCQEDLANLDAIIDGITAAVDNGDIPISRIDDAVGRILKVKENRGILAYNAADYSLEKANEVVGGEENRCMEREMAAAAITVVKNENNVLPLNLNENSKVLMLTPYNNERAQMIMGWNRAVEAGIIPDGAQVDYFRFSSTTISDELQTKLDWADTYIILTEVSSTARMEYKHWLSAMPNKLCDYAAENGKTAIIASVDKPYDVQMYPNADAIVAGYGCKGSSVDPTEAIVGGVTGSAAAYGPNIIAAVEVILGTYGAQGKLPVAVPAYDVEYNCYTDTIVYNRGYGLTYGAKQPVQSYTVTFYNGDDVTGNQTIEEGKCAVRPEDPVQEGKTFLGWYTDNGAQYDFNASVTGDINLYAKFEDKAAPGNGFDDVIEGTFYYEPVLWAVDKGITTGLSSTIFGVDENCTRGQFVTFLWRAAGCPEPTSTDNPFADVENNQFYSKAVLWAVEKGITTGLAPDTFGVNDPCTRAQVVTFLWRYMGSPAPVSTSNPFTDVEENQFYSIPILWAVENGITTGLDTTTFGVNVPCNRAQVVTFLYRAIA